MNKYWKIYKVTHRTTGECYIGCTKIRLLSQRKSLHYQKARQGRSSDFYQALRSYDPSQFIWTIIEDNIKSEERAEQRERYWIKYYDSIDSGYNANGGGWNHYQALKPRNSKEEDHTEVDLNLMDQYHARRVYCPELDKTFKSIRSCAKELGIDRKTVKRVLDGSRTSYQGYTLVEVN